jgi:uncharacterized protein (DUF2147 family)
MKTTAGVLLVLAFAFISRGQTGNADAILGEWVTTNGKARVEIFRRGGEYCGKINWLREPEKEGKPVVDDKNPDERLRAQPVLGLEILHGFSFDGENLWTGGRIYDPENGNDYSARMTMTDSVTVELRGYVLLPMFGRTETWKRYGSP